VPNVDLFSPQDNGAPITLTFSKYELECLANALCEAIDSLSRDAVHAQGRTLAEILRAQAALTAVMARAMDSITMLNAMGGTMMTVKHDPDPAGPVMAARLRRALELRLHELQGRLPACLTPRDRKEMVNLRELLQGNQEKVKITIDLERRARELENDNDNASI
jgi:hypothetical protein